MKLLTIITLLLINITYSYTPDQHQKEFGEYLIDNSPVIEYFYPGEYSLWIRLPLSEYNNSDNYLIETANLVCALYKQEVSSTIVVTIINYSSSKILVKSNI